MNFSKEVLEFPSMIQQTIYCEARELVPLEASIDSVKSKELQTSCRQYYDFYTSLLSDMYDNPTAYYLPVGEYEALLQGRTINAMKQREPAKALKVVAHVANCVMRYTYLLCLLGYFGTLEGNTLHIPPEAWKTVKKCTCVTVSPITLENRLQALTRLGLVMDGNDATSSNYPLMFAAMKALAMKTGGKSSGFDFYNFQKADFRNITKNYKPTYIDYFKPLTAERLHTAQALHDHAQKAGCKVAISTFLKVDYKYKGSQVMCIDTAKNSLRIRVIEVYSNNDFSLIEDKVKGETKEFEKYFLQHLWRCRGCSTTHLGQFIVVLGKRNRVCGGGLIGMEWFNPTADDLEYVKKLIDFRCSIIDELSK